MNQKLWGFILGLLFGTPTVVSLATPTCNQDLCSFSIPVVSDKGVRATLRNTYRYRPARADAPTVVYVPGGPGARSADVAFAAVLNVPPEFGVILTDPPFVVAESDINPEQFKNLVRSDFVARTLRAVIQDAGVEDNYILFGDSYGTVPATIFAAYKDIKKPRALVLQGTFSRARTHRAYREGFSFEKDAVFAAMNEASVANFSHRWQLLIEAGTLSGDDWWSVIQTTLMERHREQKLWLRQVVLESANLDLYKFSQYIKELTKLFVADDWSPAQRFVNSLIGCRELYFNPGESHVPCVSGSQKIAKVLYDSKNFKISAPIFYIHGRNDPASPLAEALYHYSHQNGERYLVAIADAGHTPLSRELKNCEQAFWASLKNPSLKSARILENCERNGAEKI